MRKWSIAIVGLVACGNPALRAARDGDLARLRSEIAAKHQQGRLSNADAADLARAVASREIAVARDDAQATARVQETRACSTDLDDALDDRMQKHDGAGAEAAMERLEGGGISRGRARAFLDDPDDRWRAVGVRTLVRDDDSKRRREGIVDPSPRVRRAALRASAEGKEPEDLDVLYETARLDPELLLRNEAVRAMSAVVRGDRGRGRAAELVTRLRDLWTGGDDAVREDVAVAWALAPVFESGGREALRVAIAQGQGPGAIAAAGVVTRTQQKDGELVASSYALLARTIAEGSRRDRMHAIATARVEGAALGALRKAAQDDDAEVRVAALARLLDVKEDHDVSVRALEAIAAYGAKGTGRDDARRRELASRARFALANGGDLRVQAWIEEDLAEAAPERRLMAASALAALGRAARAAPLLADGDPSVRTRAACTLLVAARR
jgi:hypothetical protein